MKPNRLTLTLCAAISLVIAHFAAAQSANDPAPFHRHHHRNLNVMLTRLLNLSDEQQAQIKSLVAEVQPQIDAIRKQARDATEPIIKQLHARIRPLLTPEQQKRLEAFETLRETRPEPGVK